MCGSINMSRSKGFFLHQTLYKESKFLPSSFQIALRFPSLTVALECFHSSLKSNHCLKMQSSGWKVESFLSCSLEFLCWQICPAMKKDKINSTHVSILFSNVIYLIPKMKKQTGSITLSL